MTSTPSIDEALGPRLTRAHALFLDFDGTLAPIQDDPETVALPVGGAQTLHSLAAKLGQALVLLSGRDIRDLSTRTPVGLWRAGGHGLEICAPDEAPPVARQTITDEIRSGLSQLIAPFANVRMEEKGRVVAIHYRQNPDAGPSLVSAISTFVGTLDGYSFQHGKMVLELKPEGANKGRALETLMQKQPFKDRSPIMIGDDTTDEDAILAAERLGGYGIKVGAGDTQASFRFADPDEVWAWLKRYSE